MLIWLKLQRRRKWRRRLHATTTDPKAMATQDHESTGFHRQCAAMVGVVNIAIKKLLFRPPARTVLSGPASNMFRIQVTLVCLTR